MAFFSFDNINKDNKQSEECSNGLIEGLVNNESEAIDQNQSDINLSAETETDSTINEWKFSTKIFNLLCLCEEEYVVEPETLRFLVGHGFDFNRQCLQGLPYHRGNDVSIKSFLFLSSLSQYMI